jgi:MoaA/NifB/PqqE/SkfB family radical SAM enzyme
MDWRRKFSETAKLRAGRARFVETSLSPKPRRHQRMTWLGWLGRLFGKSRVAPSLLRVEASSFCQLRCPSCPTTTGAIDAAVGKGFLRFSDFKALVDANSSLKRIELSNYGEVFLNPELEQILAYAHRKKVAIAIMNGANLNTVKESALRALVRYQVAVLTCSIDGASAESYEKYRVGGSFSRVIDNIRRLNTYKAELGSQAPHLIWQFVVFGHNEHEIATARALATELGMQFIPKLTWDDRFSPIRDRAAVLRDTDFGVTSRDEYEQIHGRKIYREICLQLWDDPQINWDGKVLGCCRNFWGDFGGNAFTEGLPKALNGEKIAYARDMLTGKAPPRADVPCTSCEMYQSMQKRAEFMPAR